jgi:hypothetical protein
MYCFIYCFIYCFYILFYIIFINYLLELDASLFTYYIKIVKIQLRNYIENKEKTILF